MWSFQCQGLHEPLTEFYSEWAAWLRSDAARSAVATEHARGAPEADLKRFVDVGTDVDDPALVQMSQDLVGSVARGFVAAGVDADGVWLRNEELLRRLQEPVVRITEYAAAEPGQLINYDHTDFAAVTLLPPATEAGLEILSDGSWSVIRPGRNEVIVLAGETSYLYGGPLPEHHRVRSTGRPRLSVSIFVNPPGDAVLRSGERAAAALESIVRLSRRQL